VDSFDKEKGEQRKRSAREKLIRPISSYRGYEGEVTVTHMSTGIEGRRKAGIGTKAGAV